MEYTGTVARIGWDLRSTGGLLRVFGLLQI